MLKIVLRYIHDANQGRPKNFFVADACSHTCAAEDACVAASDPVLVLDILIVALKLKRP